MKENKVLTKDELLELESAPKTKMKIMLDYLICISPVLTGLLCLLEYYIIPNHGINLRTNIYGYFIGVQLLGFLVYFILAIKNKNIFMKLRYKAPIFSVVFIFLMLYDYLTLKTGILILPYFPWVDKILNAMIDDFAYLMDCVKNSLILLFTGYFVGVVFGLITGIACGYSKKINYWVAPFMRMIGPIPTTTWLPIVMVLAATLFRASVFIIALGVWYSVTMATYTGISNVDRSLFNVAKTLGANPRQLVFNIAIPAALPNIFNGLTTGMSSACTSLLIAEMMGVESGLGWYITWQKSWAMFDNMYAAIILICITFTAVNFVLSTAKKRVLKWQEGVIQ